MEELNFIPGAVSEPRCALHMCENKCREEGFKFYRIVAIVTEEGGAARTINLRKQCYNVRRLKQGDRDLTALKWSEMVEQKAFRGKLWAAFGLEQVAHKMLERFTIEKAWARSVMAEVEKERLGGREGDWQQESPYKEELELIRHSSDLRFEGLVMRRAYYEGRSGDWQNYLEKFLKDGMLSVWASVKVWAPYSGRIFNRD